jgi:hypothetical protein
MGTFNVQSDKLWSKEKCREKRIEQYIEMYEEVQKVQNTITMQEG